MVSRFNSVRTKSINPCILKWAREKSGLTLKEISKKMGLKEKNQIIRFEAGEVAPTQFQLNKLASIYYQPQIVFYLNTPPPKGEYSTDFRKPNPEISNRQNAQLEALVRKIATKQDFVRDLLDKDPEYQDVVFVESVHLDEHPKMVAQKIAEILNFDCQDKTIRGKNAEELFSKLRSCIEQIGVFVLLAGDLGSYHTKLGPEVFRGLAISDTKAPFIVINRYDAVSTRTFTLIHELVHILLDLTGTSENQIGSEVTTWEEEIERFCSDVAGEFLLPEDSFEVHSDDIENMNRSELYNYTSRIANDWSVSESLVAYKFYRLELINKSCYQDITGQYYFHWHESLKKRDYILEYTYGLIIFNPGFQTFSVQFQGKDQKNFLPFSPSYQLLVCQSFTGHQADRVPHHHYGILPADVVTGDEFVDVSVHVFRGEVVECSMIALLQQRPE